jgi:prepilin-type N-terminal cleavage/methylation domain-containing protein
MRQSKGGFTLIEMLLVISIIVILMAVLIPAMGAAIQAVKVNATKTRIAMVDRAVREYAKRYGVCPPDTSPDRAMNYRTSDNAYAPYIYPNGDEACYIFRHGQWNERPFGGKFLAYFLMGPNGTGWHRPINATNSSDVNYRSRFITAEWDVPEGLTEFLENKPVSQGTSRSYPFPVFVDAFGLNGYNGGVIGYLRANVRRSGSSRWTVHNGAFGAALYSDCRNHPSYPGDNLGVQHGERIFSQCKGDFALLSPGADQKYGYRVTSMKHKGKDMRGNWSSIALGLCDDIGNFPLRAGELPEE